MMLKEHIKPLVPGWILTRVGEYRFRRLNRRVDRQFGGNSAAQVFANIYNSGIWGNKADWKFCSGSGSHDPRIVVPYLGAVEVFLTSLSVKPDVVDLGCGDFNVGSQIRPFCRGYIACDIVPELIASNRTRFKELDVEFRCLDAATEHLPAGDVVFLRQVLQHLNNDQISLIVGKLEKYKYLILTEHLPKGSFKPNSEKPTGPGVRTGVKSGVVLSAPPFKLRFKAEQVVCSIEERASEVRTTIYTL